MTPRSQSARSGKIGPPRRTGSSLSFEALGVGKEAAVVRRALRPSSRAHRRPAGTVNRPEAQFLAIRSGVAKVTFLPLVLENPPPPNTRLHRTRAASLCSPLSCQPLGG